jgi:hypothetical protein
MFDLRAFDNVLSKSQGELLEIVLGNGSIICNIPIKCANYSDDKILMKIRKTLIKNKKENNSIGHVLLRTDNQIYVGQNTIRVDALKFLDTCDGWRKFPAKWIKRSQLQDDKEVMLKALQFANETDLKFISDRLKQDNDIAVAIVNSSTKIKMLQHVSDKCKTSMRVISAAIKADVKNGRYVPYELLNRESAISKLVLINGSIMGYAPASVRDNERIAYISITNDTKSVKYLSKKVRSIKKFMLRVVKMNGLKLQYASAELREDLDVAGAAVTQNGKAMQWTLGVAEQNRDIMKLAIIQNPDAMYQTYLPCFRGDRELMLMAITKNGEILSHTTTRLRNDREIVMAAIKHKICNFRYASKELKDDDDLALIVFNEDKDMFQHLSPRLQNDMKFVMPAVRHNGNNIQYVSNDMKNNYTVAYAAIEQNRDAIKFIGNSVWLALLAAE